jgi:PIN domain nuclease of toxin-antitoxin system
MKIILDTHILLWSFYRPELLSAAAVRQISDPDNTVLFSPVSIWEVAIKATLNRSDFSVDPDRMLALMEQAGFVELPIVSRVALGVRNLPRHHDDPFDRLLVAQAIAESAVLLTADKKLAAYSDLVRLV